MEVIISLKQTLKKTLSHDIWLVEKHVSDHISYHETLEELGKHSPPRNWGRENV